MKKHILQILLIMCFLFTGCNAASAGTEETKALTLAVFEEEGQQSLILQLVSAQTAKVKRKPGDF